MLISFLLASFALLPAPPARAPEAVELVFGPESGTQIEKTFTTSMEMEKEELTSTMNGQPVPQEFLPEIDMFLTGKSEVRVADSYQVVEAGRPLRFVRSFEALEGEGTFEMSMPPAPDQAYDFENEHDLAGERVAFAWNAESEEYDRSPVDAEEELPDLELLAADMDLLGFLPAEAISEGDSWEVETAAVGALFQPAGELDLDQWQDDPGAPFESVEVTSEVRARLKRVERVEGQRQAVIELSGTYHDESKRPTTLEHIPVTDGTATEHVRTTYELEGELVWSLSAGHALSLEVESTFERVDETIRDEGQPGGDFTTTMTFSGEQAFRFACSAASE